MDFRSLLQLLYASLIGVSAQTTLPLSLQLPVELSVNQLALYGDSVFKMSDPNNPLNGKLIGDILRGIQLPIVSTGLSNTLGSIIPHRQLELTSNYVIPTLEYALNVTFSRSFADITQRGKCELTYKPWSAPYWPSALDSFNHKWNGADSDSLITKYAKAYGLDPLAFADAISMRLGIDKWALSPYVEYCDHKETCSTSSITDTVCVKRKDKVDQEKVCAITWEGSCQSWTLAAMLHPEPLCAVEMNGVTFEILDIKGLLTYMYNEAPVYASIGGKPAQTNTVELDLYGRPLALELRDLTAADYLLAMVNFICFLDRPFAIDRIPTLEMWNQPMNRFEIVNKLQVDPKGTAKLAFGTENFPYDEDMDQLHYLETKFCWVFESTSVTVTTSIDTFENYVECRTLYLLIEVNKEGFVIGGEYYGQNQTNIDYLWTAVTSLPLNEFTPEGIPYADILDLYARSQQCD
uniref:Glycoprotein elicitor putative n=1 Tax=Albugo laibachii Nc14 TaxID=890382 RepID=F0W0U2_9STRA|nr:glycoprotein elicitor precursor putative [Albugo laibachii Nc14]|eukprot:CCA14666.1 glycoprotein elicitor precursor putative [Albugo laibachii Nc14]